MWIVSGEIARTAKKCAMASRRPGEALCTTPRAPNSSSARMRRLSVIVRWFPIDTPDRVIEHALERVPQLAAFNLSAPGSPAIPVISCQFRSALTWRLRFG
jgi:hypothetical protein